MVPGETDATWPAEVVSRAERLYRRSTDAGVRQAVVSKVARQKEAAPAVQFLVRVATQEAAPGHEDAEWPTSYVALSALAMMDEHGRAALLALAPESVPDARAKSLEHATLPPMTTGLPEPRRPVPDAGEPYPPGRRRAPHAGTRVGERAGRAVRHGAPLVPPAPAHARGQRARGQREAGPGPHVPPHAGGARTRDRLAGRAARYLEHMDEEEDDR